MERMILDSTRDPLAASIHQILDAKIRVAAGLEDTAALEGPGDLARRSEEPEHLHGVTGQPHGQNRQAETLARARLVVDEDLRDGKGRFDGETNVADQRGVGHVEGLEGREKDLADDEAGEEVQDELPVPVRVLAFTSLCRRTAVTGIRTAWATSTARSCMGAGTLRLAPS